MRKVSCLLAVCLLFAVAGCKTGIQIQDNTYNALAGQVIKVSDEFTYVGQCDSTVMSRDAQGGRNKANDGLKTRGDVFVRSVEGQPAEVFVIQRAMLTKTGWYWTRTSGDPTEFHGANFKESFFDAKRDGGATVQSYLDFLNQNGFNIDTPDLYVRNLSKVIGSQTMADMFYGVYPGLIPEDIRGDFAKEKEFIRERFDANVTVLQ